MRRFDRTLFRYSVSLLCLLPVLFAPGQMGMRGVSMWTPLPSGLADSSVAAIAYCGHASHEPRTPRSQSQFCATKGLERARLPVRFPAPAVTCVGKNTDTRCRLLPSNEWEPNGRHALFVRIGFPRLYQKS